MSFTAKIVSAFALGVFMITPALGQQQQQANPEQQQLYMEMVQTSQQIQQLQQRAISQNEDLAEQRDQLVAMIDAEMVEIDPSAETLIDRRDELAAQLENATPGEQSEALQNANAEFQSTMEELQPYQQQALQAPQIQQMQAQFQQATMSAMEDINPEIGNMISRFNDIRNELIQMQQQ